MIESSTYSLYFYQATRLATLKQGDQNRTIFHSLGMPLAEQQSDVPGLLAVEGKGTVLQVQRVGQDETHSYSTYGHDPRRPSLLTLLGFNGEVSSLLGDYALGNGHRSYSPARMRFNSPDSLSPFGRGGLNAYCYCAGDPVNFIDPSGRIPVYLPNGQIMRANRNMATLQGQRLNLSTLTRTTSLEMLNAPPVLHPTRRASFSALGSTRKVALQRVSPIQADAPARPPEWVTLEARHEPILPAFNASANLEKPTATINPIRFPQASNQRVRRNVSESSSAATSRDSTPPQSRSASPARSPTLPYHVQTAINFRNSPNHSRRFDP